MARINKKRAPSRERYEQGHPTVSCRVSREVYEMLEMVRKTERKSFADVLKTGLGIMQVKAKEEGEIEKKANTDGYRKGYAEAQRLYRVTFPCSVCGKTVEITSMEAKKAASGYMQEHGWGHAACHERR